MEEAKKEINDKLSQLDKNFEMLKSQNPAFKIFEEALHAELYNARSHDTGEAINSFLNLAESAMNFKEEILKRNAKKTNSLNFQSMKLGINSVLALQNSLIDTKLESLNLADNCITDYGIHAIKTLISNTEYYNED